MVVRCRPGTNLPREDIDVVGVHRPPRNLRPGDDRAVLEPRLPGEEGHAMTVDRGLRLPTWEGEFACVAREALVPVVDVGAAARDGLRRRKARRTRSAEPSAAP